MELLAFTMIVVLSIGLGLAAAKLVFSVVFFYMTRNMGRIG